MAGESAYLEQALIQFEASDFGASVNYDGKDYPCSLGSVGFGGRFVAGGFSPGSEATAVIRKSVLNTAFKVGDTMTVTDGFGSVRLLKIASEGIRDCIFAWELTLNDLNQNA